MLRLLAFLNRNVSGWDCVKEIFSRKTINKLITKNVMIMTKDIIEYI